MKAVTITGTAVKRSKNDTWLSNCGSSFGVFDLPSQTAYIAITEHIATNITASSTEIAELKRNEPGNKANVTKSARSSNVHGGIIKYSIILKASFHHRY